METTQSASYVRISWMIERFSSRSFGVGGLLLDLSLSLQFDLELGLLLSLLPKLLLQSGQLGLLARPSRKEAGNPGLEHGLLNLEVRDFGLEVTLTYS